MRRVPLPVLLVAALVAALGIAGLARGAVPSRESASATSTDPIVVSGAYVREPASPDVAAAYFTVFNTTDEPDTLIGVSTGAGALAILHTDGMRAAPDGLHVPAHGRLTLATGTGHVMIEKLYGPITAGQSVNLQLSFARAGPVLVAAPVIGVLAPAPSGASS